MDFLPRRSHRLAAKADGAGLSAGPRNILHLPLGQIYGPDDFVGHDPNSTADVADGLELAEHISGKDSAELSVRRGVGGFLPRRRPTRLPLVNRATVFPKVWANTAGAAPSPRGETNNTLSCEMAFDAFPEGRGLANFPLRLEPSWQSPHYIFFFFPPGAGRRSVYCCSFTTVRKKRGGTARVISAVTDRHFGRLGERPTDRPSLWSNL